MDRKDVYDAMSAARLVASTSGSLDWPQFLRAVPIRQNTNISLISI